MNVANRPSNFGLAAVVVVGFSIVSWHAVAAPAPVTFAHDIDAKWSYVGDATLRRGDTDLGLIDEHNSSFHYILSPQVTRRALLRFGVEWQRFSFGVSDSAPVPDTLQQISALFGLDWQLTDQWLLRAEIHPGVYSDFVDVSGRDVDAPMLLSAAYLANADRQWVFGLRIDPRSNYPVIPALGLRWQFADAWTLKAILPEPRLEYELNEKFSAYLGAGFDAGTFRVSDTFGDDRGRPDLNRAILDYFEARVGPGFSWRIRPEIEIEANAGYMVYRRFEFSEQHRVLSSEPAPYVQIAGHFRF